VSGSTVLCRAGRPFRAFDAANDHSGALACEHSSPFQPIRIVKTLAQATAAGFTVQLA
jgi:hypothetical protein